MSSTEIVPLIAVAAVASTFLGGLFAIHHRDRLHLILGFSAGAVMGVVFFDLLPEAFSLSPDGAATSMAAGFVAYMILDRFLSFHSHGHEHCGNVRHRGDWDAAGFSLHSFLDGVGMGIAFNVSFVMGVMFSMTIVGHRISDGINIAAVILKNGGDRTEVIRWLVIGSLAPIGGMMVAYLIPVSSTQLGLSLAFFAGVFLHLAASDLLPESHHSHSAVWTSLSTIVGILVMGLITYLAH